jgi:MOSC domain-containing protein YiiM
MSISAAIIDSKSDGEPARYVALADLERALDTRAAAPRDRGRVTLIVRRAQGGAREVVERATFTPDEGLPGDAWGRGRHPKPEAQLAVMQTDVATLIADGQPLPLFGDNLFLDLDLSTANLPAGTRVRVGQATLEVTPMPHHGCQKLRARFGPDALRFVSMRERRHLNLRGIYMCVVEAGEIRAGDAVEVLSRPPATCTTGC